MTMGSSPAMAQDSSERIVNGHEAQAGRWPWQVELRFPLGPCGGAILSREWVATARHCVEQLDPSELRLIAGHSDRGAPEASAQVRSVAAIHFDPRDTDIALLRLDSPWDYSLQVQPALLSRKRADAGTMAVTTGWGRTEDGTLSRVLREAFVPVAPASACDQMFDAVSGPGMPDLRPDEYCAGYPDGDMDSCNGDSGGPLVVPDSFGGASYRLAGLVSWGPRHQQTGELCFSYGVYASLVESLGWIDATIGAQELLGDLNKDGCVNGTDVSLASAIFGHPIPATLVDLDADGKFGMAELEVVYGQWNTSLYEDPSQCTP